MRHIKTFNYTDAQEMLCDDHGTLDPGQDVWGHVLTPTLITDWLN